MVWLKQCNRNKWPIFHGRQFQKHVCKWKCWSFACIWNWNMFSAMTMAMAMKMIYCQSCTGRKCDQYNTYDIIVCLTHWGRVTHICVSKLAIIGSDNGLSPGRRQAIIWTNAEILLIGSLGTNFNANFNRNSNIFIEENALENVVCQMAFTLYRPKFVKEHDE